MVARTPMKPLFEENHSSNAQSLFFEFAFEPTAVSFKPQTKPLAPSARTKRKKVLYTAGRLVLGLLITAMVMGSGILDNELLFGKGTQASLAWLPSWSENSPSKSDKVKVAVVETTETININETARITGNPEALLVGSEDNTTFSHPVTTYPETNLSISTSTSVMETEKDTERKKITDPKKATILKKPAVKPIVKEPVTQAKIKLSAPVVNSQKEEVFRKRKITSDAFHAIKAQSALDGKKVFIKFGARWCLPCKMMEANVFPDPEISRLLGENYHTLTIDVDNLDGINLRQIFKVEVLPSFIILDNDQSIVGKYEGAKRIEELRSILGSTVNP